MNHEMLRKEEKRAERETDEINKEDNRWSDE